MRIMACTSVLLVALAACSDDGGNNDGVDGGGDIDATGNMTGDCREGGVSSSDRYLPMDVGNVWRYNVTDNNTGEVSIKRTEVTEIMTPEGETEPVIVQVTTKPNGQTVSWMRQVGENLVRLRQMDLDANGMLQQTTVYNPPKVRLDETLENIAVGASFSDVYTKVVYDPAGVETNSEDVIDSWIVAGEETCTLPWGQVPCLKIHREGLQSSTVNKDYFFASGIGKVREDGVSQLEELTDCNLQ